MKQLYAPWRGSYVRSRTKGKGETVDADECIFCTIIAQNDDIHNSVLKRCKNTFVLLSRFPYNAGHILILPYTHTGHLDELSSDIAQEIMYVATQAIPILKAVLGAQGINIGMNVGKIAGASIPSHLHMHVLPRWQGDTSFLPLIGHVKPISCDLNAIYTELQPHFERLAL